MSSGTTLGGSDTQPRRTTRRSLDRPLRLRLALALTPALLTGCIPAIVTPAPNLDVPNTYRMAGRQGGLEDHATDWWRTFRSSELTGFMQTTREANLDVAAAIGQIEQADALARQQGASLFPSITANQSVTRSQSSQNAFSAGGVAGSGTSLVSGTAPRTDLIASFAASYQLDLWGKNRATYKAAQETATANRWNARTVQLTALGSAATAYYNILAARERIAYIRQDVTASSEILKLIQDRLAAGTATDLDVAQQAALVANLRSSIPPLEVTVEQNIAALAVLMGVPPERVSVRGDSVLKAPVPLIAPGIPSEVLAQRPDVEYAESNLAAAHGNLVAARQAFFPTITLTAEGGFESLALKTLFSPASTFYTATYSLAQPIFDAGRLQGEYDQQKGVQDQTLAQYRKAVLTAFSDVDKALAALKLYARQEQLTRETLEAYRKAYQLSEQRLRQGVLDVVSLLQVEQNLFTTQDTLVQVRLQRLTAAISLYQALGGAYAGRSKAKS